MVSSWGIGGGLVAALLVVVHSARRWPGRWTFIVRLLAVAHVAVVAELALFPLPVDAALVADLRAHAAGVDLVSLNINLVPWATIGPSLHRLLTERYDTQEVRNLIGNLALLMPLAWYGPILWPRLRNLFWFAATAVAFSVTIELLQLAITVGLGYAHATDIDDVIVNAGGALLAFVVLWPLRRQQSPASASVTTSAG
jgi:glycopeptide antibiotics resistance protein